VNKVTFKSEYRIYRNHGFRPLKSSIKALQILREYRKIQKRVEANRKKWGYSL
jgi:hypothetical protein